MIDVTAAASRDPSPSDLGVDLTACDREPIHIPGAVQPHGLLLVADAASLEIVAGAGDIERQLAENWLGRPLADLVGEDLAGQAATLEPQSGTGAGTRPVIGRTHAFDATLHRAGSAVLVELEPAPEKPVAAATALAALDNGGARFGRAPDLRTLCEQAAQVFREVTGFDRVMVYRFLDHDDGVVIAESRDPVLGSFLNHHFPASDIPRQARALYLRNHVRVIPDVDYEPAPLRPTMRQPLDMSDVALRSVSPIHIQYLKNMGIAASASVSIVQDGVLWGLIACHHATPRNLTYDTRVVCRVLAGGLARQIRAKEEAEVYRERLQLRAAEDAIVSRLMRDEALDESFKVVREDMQQMLGADGLALVKGGQVERIGHCPEADEVRQIALWLRGRTGADPFSTSSLSTLFPPAAAYREIGSGLLTVTVSNEEPIVFLWFRAEQVEVVNWAGNPHKAASDGPGGTLTPRASFEAWSETVRGRARPWTRGESDAANRLRAAVFETRRSRRLAELNRELAATLSDKEALLREKDYLVKEVNHRVQNSLQLVSTFLNMQARAVADPVLTAELAEAQRRISAVSLVHRRLYRDDNVETIDLSRYLAELCQDIKQSLGGGWAEHLVVDLAPILIRADRAVNVGLILTELVINANKYAYGGGSGPISISLDQHRNRLRLIVGDVGAGTVQPEKGFGTRMIRAMVERLEGSIDYASNDPGLRVVVTAPIEDTGN